VLFQTSYEKLNFKKPVMMSFQLRHHSYDTEKCHQTNVTRFFNLRPLPIKISGYASATASRA